MKKIKDYLAGRTEYLIGIGALIVWLFLSCLAGFSAGKLTRLAIFKKIALEFSACH